MVIGEPNIFVRYEDAKGLLVCTKPDGFGVHFYDSESEARSLLPAHFQYYDDKNTHDFNRLSTNLQVLDCQLEQDKLQRVQMLSVFSPVLAAIVVGFLGCFHLQSFGTFRLLSRCEATKVGLDAA